MESSLVLPTRYDTLDPATRNSTSSPDIYKMKLSRKNSLESVAASEKMNSSNNPYKEKFLKLSQAVKIVYLSIKRRMMKEDAQSATELKDSIPLNEDDEGIVKKDPLVVAQYIKKIYEKTLEVKSQEQKKLIESSEESMNKYEPFLQKLEAEVRKHIQIEQQMKILIDTQQDKIIELEKEGIGKVNNEYAEKEVQVMKKEYRKLLSEKEQKIVNLDNENEMLKNQIKVSQNEILKLKNALTKISQVMKGVEN